MDPRLSRRALLATAGATAIAGCLGESGLVNDAAGGGGSAERSDDQPAPDPAAVDETSIPLAEERPYVGWDLESLRAADLSGGVPQDGIPSIDEPNFEPAADVGDRLAPGDPVFGVVHEGEARVYPQSILVHHEIVNDEVGGDPIAVTYCPLTGTAMGFERGDVEFGVSGRLLNSNLIMYDREGDSRWPQMLGVAIDGPLEAAALREVPVFWSTWETWREAYPDSEVLTEDTGRVRSYGDDPYGGYNPTSGYYAADQGPIFEPLASDDWRPPKAMVLGARPPAGPIAIDPERLAADGLVTIDLEDSSLLAVRDDRIDTGHVYRNTDGESFAFDQDTPVAEGPVTDADGERHAPDALPLEPVDSYDAMWFAWAGFYPSTETIA